jgi:hypothetical protein
MNPFKKSLDVDGSFLLAHRYRRVGVGVCILGIPMVLLLNSALLLVFNLDPAYWDEWGLYMMHAPVSLGLYLILFSQEKQEDELYLNLRLRSLAYGVHAIIVTVALLPVFASLSSLVRGGGIILPDVGGNMAVCTLLLIVANFAYYLNKQRIARDD